MKFPPQRVKSLHSHSIDGVNIHSTFFYREYGCTFATLKVPLCGKKGYKLDSFKSVCLV